MNYNYDVIVIGGGHAGCEAAVASAKLGAKTLLITNDMNRIAQMSCNPAIGGIAKGQIVREIDALGGQTGIVTDKTAIQFRMLNSSKGPAVWSPRSQSDRTAFIDEWRRILDSTPGLYIFQDAVTEFKISKNAEADDSNKIRIEGVKTGLGLEFYADNVILTAGTFLNGNMHFGEQQIPGGRISESSSTGLTEQLQALGFETGRMKTGTPARIDGRTIDKSLCLEQAGDDDKKHKFSFLPEVKRELSQRECLIVHTSPEVHGVLKASLDKSPLYNGQIQSIGPRYCPSIETKIVTFADKESHQLFLEPEGATTEEYYINGFSSSLPWDVQVEALQKIPALRNVHLYRPGYAIEYDFFPPTQLNHDLQTKLVGGLYMAGQVNGTTGYEEAAAQGLMAGINAARRSQDKEPLVLRRDQAYIGVLIDDLVNKGVDEPYRMFTSRAEYRILLRQDDADMRLTRIGYDIGLADKRRFDLMCTKKEQRDALIKWCEQTLIKPTDEINKGLIDAGTTPIKSSVKVDVLLKRPQLDFFKLAKIYAPLKQRLDDVESERRDEIIEATEILIKYGGYIEREKLLAEKAMRLEDVKLSSSFDYSAVQQLSTEARQKLNAIKPLTIGAASRIPGVSPADISILLLLMNR